MKPEDKVKDDSAIDKPAPIELTPRSAVIALIVFLGLIVTAGVMVGILVNSKPVEAIKAAPVVLSSTRIVASKDLEAYTLLNKDHLIVLRGKDDSSDDALNELLGRYLLTKATLGTEIKPDMLAPAEAKALLDNSVAVTIPATDTSSLGGQLRVGDMVDLLLIADPNHSAANQSD
jgi:Flp pilus assembly protein CpaB